jgi:hypothetical protein
LVPEKNQDRTTAVQVNALFAVSRLNELDHALVHVETELVTYGTSPA